MTKPRRPETPPPEYLRALSALVDRIYGLAVDEHDWSWVDLARESGLAYTTVARLGERVTRYPRHLTVWKLAKAVGLQLQLTEVRAKLDRRRKNVA